MTPSISQASWQLPQSVAAMNPFQPLIFQAFVLLPQSGAVRILNSAPDTLTIEKLPILACLRKIPLLTH